MKKNTFTTLFFVKRNKADKDGNFPIYCRITIKGKRMEFSINKKTNGIAWDDFNSRKKTKESSEIKAILDNWTTDINNYRRGLLTDGKEISVVTILNKIKGIDPNKKKHSFLEAVDKCFALKKSKIGDILNEETFERYDRTRKYLEEFIMERYKKKDISFDDLNDSTPDEFEVFLRDKKKCKGNTANRYFQRIKKVMKYALKRKLTSYDPFDGYEIEQTDPTHVILTEHEIKILFNKKIEIERLSKIRDFYVFCCLTGLAFSDLQKLKKSEIEITSGARMIASTRKKTNEPFITPIFGYADIILDKYYKESLKNDCEYIFPIPTNQKYNAYLKELADICNIDKNLTSHSARHTFGTTICADNEFSVEDSALHMGHKKQASTLIYYKVGRERAIKSSNKMAISLGEKYKSIDLIQNQ